MVGKLFQSSIVAASMPVVARLHDKGEKKQLETVYQSMTKWTLTFNLPLFLIMILFPTQILSLFGKSFVGGATALMILASARLADAGTGICGVVIDMTGNTRLKLINTITTVGITIGLNILLIPRLGLVGAAIATVTAALLVNALRVVEIFILFRLLPYNKSFIKPVAAGIVAFVTARLIEGSIPAYSNVIYLAFGVGFIFAIYASTLVLLGLSREDRLVLAQVRARFNILPSRN
jgi:O-antigen/teichoic acid export membrane protein